MKKSRPIITIVRLLAPLAIIIPAGFCLWFGMINPLKMRQERIAFATQFLEAYSEGDCARASAFLDPSASVFRRDIPDQTPLTFCRDQKIRILKIDHVRESHAWNGPLITNEIVFDGIFEFASYGVDPYPCPHVFIDMTKTDDEWGVIAWDGYWTAPGLSLSCRVLRNRFGPDEGPPCPRIPAVSLELRRISNTAIELTAKGLGRQEILYIFYNWFYGDGVETHGVLPLYTLNGQWLAVVGKQTMVIDPWTFSRFDYTLNLPPLPYDPTWDVRLVYHYGVACALIELP